MENNFDSSKLINKETAESIKSINQFRIKILNCIKRTILTELLRNTIDQATPFIKFSNKNSREYIDTNSPSVNLFFDLQEIVKKYDFDDPIDNEQKLVEFLSKVLDEEVIKVFSGALMFTILSTDLVQIENMKAENYLSEERIVKICSPMFDGLLEKGEGIFIEGKQPEEAEFFKKILVPNIWWTRFNLEILKDTNIKNFFEYKNQKLPNKLGFILGYAR